MLVMTKKQLVLIRLQTWNAYSKAYYSGVQHSRLPERCVPLTLS
jgi:hypothetical protein